MNDFWKAYRLLAGIGVLLCLLALLLYLAAERNQTGIDRQADEAATHLSKSFSELDANGQRQAIKDELLLQRDAQTVHELIEHIAEALFLAGIMIVCVEGITHFMAEQKEDERNSKLTSLFAEKSETLSENTWRAIFDRLIPSEIGNEVLRIVKSDVCRLRPTYTITLSNEDYRDVPSGFVVVTRRLSYRLLNITGGELKQHVIAIQTKNTTVGDIDVHTRTGQKITLPRIKTVQLDRDLRVTVKPDERMSWSATRDLPVMNRDKDNWAVTSEAEGLFLLTDRALYVLTQPCVGLEVTILNEASHLLEIQEGDIYLTNSAKLRKTGDQTWTYEGGLLSGTALSVPWRAKSQPEDRKDPTPQKGC